jgi:uncharacterized hydrophobic protein (TIGR00271 family)
MEEDKNPEEEEKKNSGQEEENSSEDERTPEEKQAEQEKHEKIDEQERVVAFSFKRLLVASWAFLKSVLNLKDGLDYESTTEGIVQDVHFRGHAAWILIFSILIASIGLNTNSVAVVIGAMLISPLMGPILAIGLAVGVNDFALLKRAVKHFAIAIGLGISISAIYFFISPIKEASPELLSRTSATVLALAVALFGGAAGIIAGSRRYKSNVVPGVAIATALMPPLCTAGYGIATFQWSFFFGAFYLFFINSVFIALPTYLYIKYMKFPVVQFVDPRREKKIKQYILIFLVVVMVPSAVIFFQVVQQSIFLTKAEVYIDKIQSELNGTDTAIISEKIEYNDGSPDITLALMGDVISEKKIDAWRLKLSEAGIENARLNIVQSKNYMQVIQDAESRSLERGTRWLEQLVATKDAEIEDLEFELRKLRSRSVDFTILEQESSILFPDIEKALFADGIETDFSSRDTLYTVFVRFETGIDPVRKMEEIDKLRRWVRLQVRRDSVRVIEY